MDTDDEKINQIREAFDMFDEKKEGSISTHRLGDVMRALGYEMPSAELDAFAKEVDADGSGDIDFEEFSAMMVKKMGESDVDHDLQCAYKSLSNGNHGLVRIEELKLLLQGVGYNVSEEEIHDMVTEHDVDHDGFLSYSEFIRTMKGL